MRAHGRRPQHNWHVVPRGSKTDILFVDEPSVGAVEHHRKIVEWTFLWPILLQEGCSVGEPVSANFAGAVLVCRLKVTWDWFGAEPSAPEHDSSGCFIDLKWKGWV